jgi:hypothetical protein
LRRRTEVAHKVAVDRAERADLTLDVGLDGTSNED